MLQSARHPMLQRMHQLHPLQEADKLERKTRLKSTQRFRRTMSHVTLVIKKVLWGQTTIALISSLALLICHHSASPLLPLGSAARPISQLVQQPVQVTRRHSNASKYRPFPITLSVNGTLSEHYVEVLACTTNHYPGLVCWWPAKKRCSVAIEPATLLGSTNCILQGSGDLWT